MQDLEQSLTGAGVLAGLFGVLFVAERVWPLRERRRATGPRILVNLGAAVVAAVAAGLLVGPTAQALLGWTGTEGVGLLRWLALPGAVEIGVGLLLMDLTFYWWHPLNHRVPLLWRFHAQHHTDPDLDLTTATRFHFGEIGLSAGFRAVQITLIGLSPLVYVTYEIGFLGATLFHHSNLRLPARADRLLTALVVTPRMHGIHHSQVRAETDSNYSVILTVWDRLHRTLRLDVRQERIRIGVPGYDHPRDDRLRNVLLAPFRKQRPYWPEQEGPQDRSLDRG